MLKKLFKKYACSWEKDNTTPSKIKKLVYIFVEEFNNIEQAEKNNINEHEVNEMWKKLYQDFEMLPKWLKIEMDRIAEEMGIY